MSEVFVCPLCKRRYQDPEIRVCPVDGRPLFRPDSLLRVGQQLDKYRIQEVIGEGGMGVVYRGEHVYLRKQVALKILHRRYARRRLAVESFLHEAQAASSIEHPNIINVTDFGQGDDECVYLVMEHLNGIALDDVLARKGWVPLFNAVNITRQTAQALAAAHDVGIVHLDLKPENIYLIKREGRRRVVRMVQEDGQPRFVVEKEGSFDFVKLLDFGVAKVLHGDSAPSRNDSTGQVMGTPHYMSPEQAQGKSVDARSDIYALGILLYEMVTGAVPFDGATHVEVLNGHIRLPVPPVANRNPMVRVDPGTVRTINRCLEKSPDRRFQNMDELLVALEDCFTDQVFLRDAERLPGALESGIEVPNHSKKKKKSDNGSGGGSGGGGRHGPVNKRSVTDDLKDLFAPTQRDRKDSGESLTSSGGRAPAPPKHGGSNWSSSASYPAVGRASGVHTPPPRTASGHHRAVGHPSERPLRGPQAPAKPGRPVTSQPRREPANDQRLWDPGYPMQAQQGYPPQGQQGYPPQGQQGYPPQGQQGYPPQAQQGYPPQAQQGYPQGWQGEPINGWSSEQPPDPRLPSRAPHPSSPYQENWQSGEYAVARHPSATDYPAVSQQTVNGYPNDASMQAQRSVSGSGLDGVYGSGTDYQAVTGDDLAVRDQQTDIDSDDSALGSDRYDGSGVYAAAGSPYDDDDDNELAEFPPRFRRHRDT